MVVVVVEVVVVVVGVVAVEVGAVVVVEVVVGKTGGLKRGLKYILNHC